MKNLGYMRLLLYTLICAILVSIYSCNKRAKSNISVSTETDSLSIDSIKRDSLFEARGDTIFANVLYGMNKQEAQQSLKQFQENLKHCDPKIAGFDFAKIHFMEIDVCDFETHYSTSTTPYDYDAFLWKGKLSSVTWNSYYQYANSRGRIEYVLNDFIKYFENRFGKPNFKNTEPSYWLHTVQNEQYFLDKDLAIWETSKRKIVIGIKGVKWPQHDESTYAPDSKEREYKYEIIVRFFDKKSLKEMDAYRYDKIEEKGRERREKEKQDSLKSINSL